MNKFPKCESNYRNVADYAVKSNMRRNYTWGGDVEIRPDREKYNSLVQLLPKGIFNFLWLSAFIYIIW